MVDEGKRFSGAEWYSEKREIMLVGCGGIGSWTALNLARNDHYLYIVDGDTVDGTNVTGGQLFSKNCIGKNKTDAVLDICREFGCTSDIITIPSMYNREIGMMPICITGLDNMKARTEVFEEWIYQITVGDTSINDFLFIDGRLTMEMFEIFCIQGNNTEQVEEYHHKHLFSDEEAQELNCTQKQTTFAAMGIASMITATLCNWLVNKKEQAEFREVPFYQRFYFPALFQTKSDIMSEEVVHGNIR